MTELRYSKDKITFLVNTQISIGLEHKGGSYALHKLAYELAERGHYIYIFNEPIYYHERIRVISTTKIIKDNGWWGEYTWELFNYNYGNTVSINPQTTWGNPFNTQHVVRWILHDYDESQWSTYGENDLICNYGSFKVPNNTKQIPLTVFDYKLDLFQNNKKNRKGFGHILHKKTPTWGIDFLEKIGSSEIPHFNGEKSMDYLVDEFNKYEYVLTFDDKTYYTTAAALCGAKVIILNPDKNMTPLEYRILNPIQMCGVAYGFDDISWANNTIDIVRNNIINLETKDKNTVDLFVKYWEDKIL